MKIFMITVKDKLVAAYKQLNIGDPLDQKNHVGPLIDKDAVKMYLDAIEKCKAEGGNFIVEGGVVSRSRLRKRLLCKTLYC